MKYLWTLLALPIIAVTFYACDSGSGVGTSATNNFGAAIGGLFSSQGAAAVDVENACNGGEEGGPEGVENNQSITAGTYGATGDAVTVDETDDCEDNPSSAESFTQFTLTQDIAGDCTSGNDVTMKTGSTGIFRNTETHTPEIYGTFDFEAGGETFADVKCTIRLTEGGVVDTDNSSCVDSDGESLSLSSSDTCTFGN